MPIYGLLSPARSNLPPIQLNKKSNSVGRDSKCDAVIRQRDVSGVHACLKFNHANQAFITSEDPRNPVVVNGLPVHGSSRLRPGSSVAFGSANYTFEMSLMSPTPSSHGAMANGTTPLPEAAAAVKDNLDASPQAELMEWSDLSTTANSPLANAATPCPDQDSTEKTEPLRTCELQTKSDIGVDPTSVQAFSISSCVPITEGDTYLYTTALEEQHAEEWSACASIIADESSLTKGTLSFRTPLPMCSSALNGEEGSIDLNLNSTMPEVSTVNLKEELIEQRTPDKKPDEVFKTPLPVTETIVSSTEEMSGSQDYYNVHQEAVTLSTVTDSSLPSTIVSETSTQWNDSSVAGAECTWNLSDMLQPPSVAARLEPPLVKRAYDESCEISVPQAGQEANDSYEQGAKTADSNSADRSYSTFGVTEQSVQVDYSASTSGHADTESTTDRTNKSEGQDESSGSVESKSTTEQVATLTEDESTTVWASESTDTAKETVGEEEGAATNDEEREDTGGDEQCQNASVESKSTSEQITSFTETESTTVWASELSGTGKKTVGVEEGATTNDEEREDAGGDEQCQNAIESEDRSAQVADSTKDELPAAWSSESTGTSVGKEEDGPTTNDEEREGVGGDEGCRNVIESENRSAQLADSTKDELPVAWASESTSIAKATVGEEEEGSTTNDEEWEDDEECQNVFESEDRSEQVADSTEAEPSAPSAGEILKANSIENKGPTVQSASAVSTDRPEEATHADDVLWSQLAGKRRAAPQDIDDSMEPAVKVVRTVESSAESPQEVDAAEEEAEVTATSGRLDADDIDNTDEVETARTEDQTVSNESGNGRPRGRKRGRKRKLQSKGTSQPPVRVTRSRKNSSGSDADHMPATTADSREASPVGQNAAVIEQNGRRKGAGRRVAKKGALSKRDDEPPARVTRARKNGGGSDADQMLATTADSREASPAGQKAAAIEQNNLDGRRKGANRRGGKKEALSKRYGNSVPENPANASRSRTQAAEKNEAVSSHDEAEEKAAALAGQRKRGRKPSGKRKVNFKNSDGSVAAVKPAAVSAVNQAELTDAKDDGQTNGTEVVVKKRRGRKPKKNVSVLDEESVKEKEEKQKSHRDASEKHGRDKVPRYNLRSRGSAK